jgi:hypothetical protein
MNLAPCLFVFCLRFELKFLYFVSKFWAICVYVLVLIVLGVDLVIHDNQIDVMLLFEFVKELLILEFKLFQNWKNHSIWFFEKCKKTICLNYFKNLE